MYVHIIGGPAAPRFPLHLPGRCALEHELPRCASPPVHQHQTPGPSSCASGLGDSTEQEFEETHMFVLVKLSDVRKEVQCPISGDHPVSVRFGHLYGTDVPLFPIPTPFPQIYPSSEQTSDSGARDSGRKQFRREGNLSSARRTGTQFRLGSDQLAPEHIWRKAARKEAIKLERVKTSTDKPSSAKVFSFLEADSD
ncbi:hypothetical protein V2J09_004349 [Rumex salicifolius]